MEFTSSKRGAPHKSRGAYANVDLGITKLRFELGAGKDSFVWA